VASLLASTVQAQRLPRPRQTGRAPRGEVHRLEVNNGATQTVRYYGQGLSPGERTTLRELEQIENEMNYARNLQALKLDYIVDERFLQSYRTDVQRALYGVDVTRNVYAAGIFGGLPGYSGVPAYTGFGYGRFGDAALVGGGTTVESSLAFGVGDEGAIKTALARTIAQQATPEYMASLDRAYERVALRASGSPTLRVALDLPSVDVVRAERSRNVGVEADMTPTGPVVLTLKSGEKIVGKKMSETKDWYIVEKVGGGTTRVRPSEVTRMDVNDASKVRFAAD
jgi:hypothetical protein